MRLRKLQSSIDGVRHCGTNLIASPASRIARVTAKSSETVPRQYFNTSHFSKVDRRIPNRAQVRGESSTCRNKPAITSCCTDGLVAQGRNQTPQPSTLRSRVGIDKDKDSAARVRVTSSHTQVVNFLSAVACWAGDHPMNRRYR